MEALKRVLLRASQGQPLLLVFEGLHWMDAETQAVLTSLVESVPTARLLVLVTYRPEYQHPWGSKTYYSQCGWIRWRQQARRPCSRPLWAMTPA